MTTEPLNPALIERVYKTLLKQQDIPMIQDKAAELCSAVCAFRSVSRLMKYTQAINEDHSYPCKWVALRPKRLYHQLTADPVLIDDYCEYCREHNHTRSCTIAGLRYAAEHNPLVD